MIANPLSIPVLLTRGVEPDHPACRRPTDKAEPLPTNWWATGDVASFLGVAPSTIRAYVARGQMPGADRRIGREPVWRPATIRKWHRPTTAAAP